MNSDLNVVLGIIALVTLISFVIGVVISHGPLWKSSLIVFVLSACGYSLYPPKESLRLGLDLAGGTELLYDLDVSNSSDPSAAIANTIRVLQERVDPQGVLNLVFRVEQGNRLVIQMPQPSDEVKALRKDLESAREAASERNVTQSQVMAALRSEDRAGSLAKLSMGVNGREELLKKAGEAYDRMVALQAQYDALGAASEDQIRMAPAVADAQIEFEKTMKAVMATNLDLPRLGQVLEMPVGKATAGAEDGGEAMMGGARGEALKALKAEHPTRVGDIDALVKAYDAYKANKKPLDDPADLIRLLKGSGVLEFRITVDPNEVAASKDTLLENLAKRGPSAGKPDNMIWYPFDDAAEFFNESSTEAFDKKVMESTEEDIWAYGQSKGYVVGKYGNELYLLMWDVPGKRMTRSEGDWGIYNVVPSYTQDMQLAVAFSMNTRGSVLMQDMTQPNVDRKMAIVLNDTVYSAPVIREALSSTIQVSGGRGGFTQGEVDYLMRTLKAGALDAGISQEPIAIRTLGSEYGKDNLDKGLEAAKLALIVVAIFMFLYYFFGGAVADLALVSNIVIILGVMAMLRAVFTLPGIAGIVLTIGMCVDANVLIFERVREELNRGTDMHTALRLGYSRALSAIIDGNLTNLIVCFILYYTASADIRGFAVTLGLGICATLFTSLFMTRVIFDLYERLFGIKRMRMLPMVVPLIEKIFTPAVKWISLRWAFFTFSGVLIAVSLVLSVSRGKDLLDIEFRAGTEVSFELAGKGEEGKDRVTMPLPEARDRVMEAGQWFEASFDPSTLKGDAALRYEQVYPQLKEIVAERQAALIAEAKEEAKPVGEELSKEKEAEVEAEAKTEAIAATDLSQLAYATVVAVGETGPESEGYPATAFTVVSTVSDSRTVAGAIKALFSDKMDAMGPIAFAGEDKDHASEATGAVHLINTENLGQILGTDVDASHNNVGEYMGGVAIELKDLSRPVTVDEVKKRITTMRLQPDHEGEQFRPFEVIGLDPVAGQPGYFGSVAVVVRDSSVNGVERTDAWMNDLAQPEWELVRDAMSRDPSLSKVSNFTPSVARTKAQEAIVAIVISILAIIAYIWFRFGSFRYGLAAVAALVHDVIITLGLIAISGYLYQIPFFADLGVESFRINMVLIAAFLTIIGYSLNDTIVVFDRIRENRGKLSYATAGVINDSINQTFSRSVLTSGTTLLAIVMMYSFGGEGVREFAFALLGGILVGTYSSVAIASPVLVMMSGVMRRRMGGSGGGGE